MNFEEIASVSGKSGLFKVLKPTRTGMILESLSDRKKLVVGMHTKVSVLSDISIYTTDGEGSVPLKEVMGKIHQEFKGDTGLSAASDPDELKSFLKFILPSYDEDRVYISDIKKLVSWYNQMAALAPDLFEEEPTGSDNETKGAKNTEEE